MPNRTANILQKSFPASLDYASLLAFYEDPRRKPQTHYYTDYYGRSVHSFGVKVSFAMFLRHGSVVDFNNHDNYIRVMELAYHNNPILKFCESGEVIVSNCGYHTQSTYRKIEQFLGMSAIIQHHGVRVWCKSGKVILQPPNLDDPSFEPFSIKESLGRYLDFVIMPDMDKFTVI